MCGICACLSKQNSVQLVVDGLKKLEYRGYDSAGISYLENNEIRTIKTVGEICHLEEKVNGLFANLVIGHTRWATHGAVEEKNAHPHLSMSNKISLVHNGIIENYKALKSELSTINFRSDTDSEVFVNLIDLEEGNLLQKFIHASKKVQGSFAVALISDKGDFVVGKRESPLYVAYLSGGGVMATSDVYVLNNLATNFFTLKDDEFAVLKENETSFYNKNGEKIHKKCEKMQKFDKISAIFEKTHMKSEILETKSVLKTTLENYFNQNIFENLNIPKKIKEINLIACGTAYHSALLGAEYFKRASIPAHVYVASEFRYGNEILNKNALYIFVSQSGETADTIACAKICKEKKMKCLALTNTPNCFLNQICKNVLPTFAGREIAVASTKAYSCQVFVLFLFSLYLKGEFYQLKNLLEEFVADFKFTDINDKLVDEVLTYKKIFFVGREEDYVTALEASLKLKEITYINCFAIASGELKHGTLALIDKNSLVIAICTQEKIKDKLISNLEEIEARGGKIMLVSNFDIRDENYLTLKLPNSFPLLMPIVSIIPLQFLALKSSEKLGYNPDKPRNLAKSVTVE